MMDRWLETFLRRDDSISKILEVSGRDRGRKGGI